MADNNLVNALANITAANQSPEGRNALAIASTRGNDLANNNPIIADSKNLTPAQFVIKHGADAAQQVGLVNVQQANNERALYDGRSGLTQAGDLLADVAAGGVQAVGGVTTLGALAVNRDLAIGSAERTNEIAEFFQGLQSDRRTLARNNAAIAGELDKEDNNRQYEKDVKTEGELTANLRYLGRGFTNAASRLGEDDVNLIGSLGEAAGSILPAGPISKVLSGIGKATVAGNVMRAQARGGMPGVLAAARARNTATSTSGLWGNLGTMPASIAAMEGGGAYNAVITEVMGMSHDDLMKSSPDYAALINEGTEQDEAKRQIAHSAGVYAASVQAPISGVTAGVLHKASEFAAAPLARVPLRDAFGRMASEPLEEGIQSATGEFAQNFGIQQNADQDRRLLEGVGDATAEGAILGMGVAGAFSAPSVAGSAIGLGVKGATAAGKAAAAPLVARGARIEAENAKQFGRDTAKVIAEVDKANAQATEAADFVQSTITPETPVEQVTELQSMSDNLRNMAVIPDTEIISDDPTKGISPDNQGIVTDNRDNRYKAINALLSKANDESLGKLDRAQASADAAELINTSQEYMNDVRKFTDQFPDEAEGRRDLMAMQTLYNELLNTKAMKDVETWLSDPDTYLSAEIDARDAQSAESQAAISEVVKRSTYGPDANDPKTARDALFQIKEGNFNASPRQYRTLASNNAMRLAGEAMKERPASKDTKGTVNLVSQQITSDATKGGEKTSIYEHDRIINGHLEDGDMQAAAKQFGIMRNFAQSMVNKATALMDSAAAGGGMANKKAYQRSNPRTGIWINDKEPQYMTYHPNRDGSTNFAKTVYAEAKAAAAYVNYMAEHYPEFNQARVELPPFNLSKATGTEVTTANQVAPVVTEQVTEQVEAKPVKAPKTKKEKRANAEQLSLDFDAPIATKPDAEPKTENAEPKEEAKPVEKPTEPVVEEKVTEAPVEAEPVAKVETPKAIEKEPVAALPAPKTRTENLTRSKDEKASVFDTLLHTTERSRNRMSDDLDPLATILDATSSADALRDYLGKDLPTGLNTDRLKTFRGVINFVNYITNQLTNNMANLDAAKKELIRKGTSDLTRNPEFQMVNISEFDGENFVPNKAMTNLAVMAALDVVLNASKYFSRPTVSDTARALLISDSEVTTKMINQVANTINPGNFQRQIAGNIMRFWGVTAKNTSDLGRVQSLALGVAAEMFEVMSEGKYKFFGINKLDIPEINNRNFQRIDFNDQAPSVKKTFEEIKSARTLLADMVLGEDSGETFTIGSPTANPARTKNNSTDRNTSAENSMIDAANNTVYSFDQHMFNIYAGLEQHASEDENVLNSFRGGFNYKPGDTNINVEASWEGKNRTIATAQKYITEYVDSIKDAAIAAGKSLSEIQSFWPHAITSVGRMMQLGGITPQSDKSFRHISIATYADVDMTDPSNQNFFWLSVAQSMDRSPEKGMHEVVEQIKSGEALPTNISSVLTDIRDAFMNEDGKYRHLIDAARNIIEENDYIQDRSSTYYADPTGLVKGFMEAMKADGYDATEHGLSNILNIAHYVNALESGADMTKFRTNAYVEADGKTNGPAMAMVMLGVRSITTSTGIETLARTGFFMGEESRTLNEQLSADKRDSYSTSSNHATVASNNMRKDLIEKDKLELLDQFDRVNRVMAALSMNVSFDAEKGEITISRAGAKNPVTITIYGAGDRGIAANFVNEILFEYYHRLGQLGKAGMNVSDLDSYVVGKSDGLYKQGQSLIDDINHLIQYNVIGSEQVKINDTGFLNGNNPFKATITSMGFETLVDNVQLFFVAPLMDGVDKEIKRHINSNTELMIASTQTMSLFAQAIQKTMITHAIEKRRTSDPDYRMTDYLSNKELREIEAKVSEMVPTIKTPTQTFNFLNSDMGPVTPYRVNGKRFAPGVDIAKSSKGHFPVSLETRTYDTAGVRAVPSTVQGMGDGMIIQGVYKHGAEAMETGTPIYDGIHFSIPNMVEGSRAANQAAYDAIFSNPMKYFSKDFNRFASNNFGSIIKVIKTYPEIYKNFMEGMSQVYNKNGNTSTNLTTEQLIGLIDDIAYALEASSIYLDARNKVLKNDVSWSVDQMGTVGANFSVTNELKLADFANADEFAFEVNKRIEAENKRLRAIASKNHDNPLISRATPFDTDVTYLPKFVSEQGVVTDSGAVVLMADNLFDYVNNNPTLFTADQKTLFTEAVRVARSRNIAVVFGTPQELNAYEQQNYPDSIDPAQPTDYLGKYSSSQRVIYMSNLSNETLLHELIHSATADTVFSYYEGRKVHEETANAIERLDALMTEWMADITLYKNEMMSPTVEHTYNVISDYLVRGEIGHAINEFMAWGLSNHDMMSDLSSKEVKSPIARITSAIMDVIKRVIFGNKPAPKSGDSLLSNVRFNARILMSNPSRFQPTKQVSLFQTSAFGSSDKLSALQKKLDGVLDALPDPMNTAANDDVAIAKRKATRMTAEQRRIDENIDIVSAAGFSMTPQEQAVFKGISQVIATNVDIDRNSLNAVRDVYSDFLNKVRPEFFYPTDRAPTEDEKYVAQNKFNLLTGGYDLLKDKQGRLAEVPVFLGLAITNDGFREVLSKLELTGPNKITGEGLNGYLDNIGTAMMDRISSSASGKGRDPNMLATMDRLQDRLIKTNEKANTFNESTAANLGDKFEDYAVNGLNNFGSYLFNFGKKNKNATILPARFIARTAIVLGALFNRDQAEIAKNGFVSYLNKADATEGFQAGITPLVREVANEIIGETDGNREAIRGTTLARAKKDQGRQNLRENTPKLIESKFTNKPSLQGWTDMFHVFGKSGLSVLAQNAGVKNIRKWISEPKELTKEKEAAVAIINKLDSKRAAQIIEKADQLANFHNTGKHGVHFLGNGYAIAHLAGMSQGRTVGTAPAGIIDAINKYVALKSLEGLPEGMLNRVAEIASKDADAIDYMVNYMSGMKKDEENKKPGVVELANHYMGYTPSEGESGTSLVIIDKADMAEMIMRGYTYHGDYKGSYGSNVNMAYMYAPIAMNATYNQGAIVTTGQTYNGIHPGTGFTVGTVATRVIAPLYVKRLQHRISKLTNKDTYTENLRPVFDSHLNVVAYEYMADPAKLALTNPSTHLGKMIGAWAGRNFEEAIAMELNSHMVEAAADQWNNANTEEARKEFVNLANSPDKIHQDTWRLMPAAVKTMIEEAYGEPGMFMVRRGDVNDFAGTRSASIGDAWTGNTRWNEGTQEFVRKVLIGIWGKGAYTAMVRAERAIQDVVTDAKVLIVVKSIIVPMANTIANVHQLMNRGVPITAILRGTKDKVAEINEYVKMQPKLVELQADLRSAEGSKDSIAIRKINQQIKVIENKIAGMSIAPLLEAGEFSAVTDGGVSQEDIAISEGRWGNYVEKLGNSLPDPLKTVYQYGTLSRDTSLFKGLARAVQYSDFVAKAILYEDMVVRKKLSHDEAMNSVAEAFINYNRFAGRNRGYLESMGLMWFWNFKLRAMKEANYLLRNHPVRSLIGMMAAPVLPIIGSIGSPITDNFASTVADGRIIRSIGPGMAFRAPSLNPWWQLFN